MGKYQPGSIGPGEKFLGEIVDTAVRHKLLGHLEASITEERAAIADYRRRADYARNFPEIAKLYLHIADEEAHHLQEFSDELRKIQ
jgi:rubrerythrin